MTTSNRVFRVTTMNHDVRTRRRLTLSRVVECVSAGVVTQVLLAKLYLAGVLCDGDLTDLITGCNKVESWSPLDYCKYVDQDFNPDEWNGDCSLRR